MEGMFDEVPEEVFIDSSGLSIGSSGILINSSGYVLVPVESVPDFRSGTVQPDSYDELLSAVYTTNSLIFCCIICLCFIFIRKVLLAIRGRFFD